jgi:hypothetical protein
MMNMVGLLRRLWPIPALLVVSLLVQKVGFESRYDVSGHAAGHLGSSTAIFLGLPVLLILLWVLPRTRLLPLVLLGCGVWLIGLLGVAVGNVRVVDAIGSANWSISEASSLGPSRPGFESGHTLAERAPLLAVAGALAIIAAVWLARFVSTYLAIVSAVSNIVLPPPWIFPGFGVIVVTATLVLRRERNEVSDVVDRGFGRGSKT